MLVLYLFRSYSKITTIQPFCLQREAPCAEHIPHRLGTAIFTVFLLCLVRLYTCMCINTSPISVLPFLPQKRTFSV